MTGNLEFVAGSSDRDYDNDSDTLSAMPSKIVLTLMITTASYDHSKMLPVYVSPTEKLVKKKITEFTGLAKITAPYIVTSKKPSSINDVIQVQGTSYECMSIPRTYLSADNFSPDTLSNIADSDFVGIKRYVFNPFDENGCKEFDLQFMEDVYALKFCNGNMADKFSILTIEAFRDQKRLTINGNPVVVYALFVNQKPEIKDANDAKDVKVNGNTPAGKSIYLLKCNSSSDDCSKYTHKNNITH